MILEIRVIHLIALCLMCAASGFSTNIKDETIKTIWKFVCIISVVVVLVYTFIEILEIFWR